MSKLLVLVLSLCVFIAVEAQVTMYCEDCGCSPCWAWIGSTPTLITDYYSYSVETTSDDCSLTSCNTQCGWACYEYIGYNTYTSCGVFGMPNCYLNSCSDDPCDKRRRALTNSSNSLSSEKKRALSALKEVSTWTGAGWNGVEHLPTSERISGTVSHGEYTEEEAIYIGCFTDTSTRDLNGAQYGSTFANTEDCIDWCRGQGFAFSGLQFYGQCFCGNSYGAYGTATNCNTQCSDGETCGGAYANSVYLNGVIGCFTDTSTRDLSYTLSGGSSSMTVEWCSSGCAGLGYIFAGLQDGNQCFCGDHVGSYGQASAGTCWMTCTGDSSENCGGSYANYVVTAKD